MKWLAFLLGVLILGQAVSFLVSMWSKRRRDEMTLAEQYRELWQRPVLINGEERLPVARRLE